jgi:hypothetical protein
MKHIMAAQVASGNVFQESKWLVEGLANVLGLE